MEAREISKKFHSQRLIYIHLILRFKSIQLKSFISYLYSANWEQVNHSQQQSYPSIFLQYCTSSWANHDSPSFNYIHMSLYIVKEGISFLEQAGFVY